MIYGDQISFRKNQESFEKINKAKGLKYPNSIKTEINRLQILSSANQTLTCTPGAVGGTIPFITLLTATLVRAFVVRAHTVTLRKHAVCALPVVPTLVYVLKANDISQVK